MTSDRNNKHLISKLAALAPKILFGTLSSTYRTCGKPTCICHRGERHGPYLHVSYRADGRTQGFNVPGSLQAQVADGVEAWKRFQAIARELAEHNRQALGLGLKRSLEQRKRPPRRTKKPASETKAR